MHDQVLVREAHGSAYLQEQLHSRARAELLLVAVLIDGLDRSPAP